MFFITANKRICYAKYTSLRKNRKNILYFIGNNYPAVSKTFRLFPKRRTIIFSYAVSGYGFFYVSLAKRYCI